jgi:hypothetical protein
MNQKTFSFVGAVIFLLVALLHGLRLVYGWSAVIGGWSVPTWVSWAALVIAAVLSYQGFRLAK